MMEEKIKDSGPNFHSASFCLIIILPKILTAQLLTQCPQSKLLAEWRKHLLEAGSGPEQASWPPVLR
ncbi:MAG: hypothetical protein NTW21_43225 [Verrucomicrobia bacterium]|nr:hypothetical protein [Verrucomicrobiota bacterium]